MAQNTLIGRLEDRDSWSAADCSMAKALDVIGRRASMLLLREAFYGARRFDEFARRSGLSEAIVAARLREMTDEGVFRREAYQDPGQRRRQQYVLTDKGRELYPVLVALMKWGDRHLASGGGPVELRHAECGGTLAVELRCSRGHRVEPADVQAALRAASDA